MRRFAAAFVAVLLLVLAAPPSDGLPLRAGVEVGNPAAALVVRPGRLDIKFGYTIPSALQISVDYRLLDSFHLVDFLALFAGAGGYVRIGPGDAGRFALGARVPVGLHGFARDGLVEIFVEVVPTVQLAPELTVLEELQGYFGFTVPIPFS